MTDNIKQITEQFDSAVECQKAGNFPEAMFLYRKILSIQPNHEPSIGNLSVVAKQIRNYDLAIKLLDKLIRLNPNDANASSATKDRQGGYNSIQ